MSLPASQPDEAAVRFRELRFEGLSRVTLHAAREPGKRLLATLREAYARLSQPPRLEAIAA